MKDVNVINIGDPAGKKVGRRRPQPALEIADGLQRFVNEHFKESGHRFGRRGVFRFNSHEEANAWMKNSIRPKKN
jgi:hypothetical protein